MLFQDNVFPGEWSLHRQTVHTIWSSFGKAEGNLSFSGNNSHCPIFFSKNMDALGHEWPSLPPLRLSLDLSPPSGHQTDQGRQACCPSGDPSLADPTVVPRVDSADRSPVANSPEERPPFPGERDNLASRPKMWALLHMAPQRELTDLPARVLSTLSETRASSMRRLYALKWFVFSDWCSVQNQAPLSCKVPLVLSLWVAPCLVYVEAIAAHHSPVAGRSLGRSDLAVCYLKGARRLNPPWPLTTPRGTYPQSSGLEPLQSAELRPLSLQTALLLA